MEMFAADQKISASLATPLDPIDDLLAGKSGRYCEAKQCLSFFWCCLGVVFAVWSVVVLVRAVVVLMCLPLLLVVVFVFLVVFG